MRSGVSFVSVTQQFNTTTSMGRLTLNVLLSFAQFEREVTAERIRDKIAASKKKGMWMGGVVPLGYRVENRKLLDRPNRGSNGALAVRSLSGARIGSCARARKRRRTGLTGRASRRRNGEVQVTHPFGRGNLYHLLSNPIYVGRIRHRDQVYDGEHQRSFRSTSSSKCSSLLANSGTCPAKHHQPVRAASPDRHCLR